MQIAVLINDERFPEPATAVTCSIQARLRPFNNPYVISRNLEKRSWIKFKRIYKGNS